MVSSSNHVWTFGYHQSHNCSRGALSPWYHPPILHYVCSSHGPSRVWSESGLLCCCAPPFDASSLAFTSLISSFFPPCNRPFVSKFIKKLKDIPEIVLPPSFPRKADILISEKGLVRQFTSLFPSPKTLKKMGREKLVSFHIRKNLYSFLWKRLLHFSFWVSRRQRPHLQKRSLLHGFQRLIL